MATERLEFVIEGMDCADCAKTIEAAVGKLPGVGAANVNFGTGRLSVAESGGVTADLPSAIERTVSAAGYRATPANRRGEMDKTPFWRRERRVLTTAVGTASAMLAFALSLLGAPTLAVNGLFAVTLAVSGYGFARAGLLAARSGRADMNLLMTIAAIGAAALGDWAEAATVVLLFAFGGTLQAFTLDKTRDSIRALMDVSPATALVRRSGGSYQLSAISYQPSVLSRQQTADSRQPTATVREMRLPVEEVQPGETVLVGPSERVPLDGVILEGVSQIDQSPITGESIPVDVAPGSEVYAGTINQSGAFVMRVLRAANDTTLAHIIHLVEEAQGRRAPSQQFVDRFAAIYTPLVIAGAVLVAVVPPLLFAQPFGDWFYKALVLLVIACPCALVISTPVSIVAAIGAATRRGVLIKGGATLETLSKIRSIAFDKTGTLTEGRPHVVSVHALDGDHAALLALAGAVESQSEHPLARAVVHAANGRQLSAISYQLSALRRMERSAIPTADSRQPTADSQWTEQIQNPKSLPGLGAQAEVDGRTVYVGNARLFAERGIHLDGVASVIDKLREAGNTEAIVGTQAGVLGVLALADTPRREAKAAVEMLRRAGFTRIAMLTGDNPRTAAAIAEQVGLDDYYAELLPADKLEAVKRMEAEHGPVAMVGDGVNDAPALAAASVGIAMGVAGTDAALEVADVALMGDDLSRLSYAALLSRETVRVIKQNITVSLAIKAFALGLAAFGALPLWGAIAADMGVSLLVTLNGMRLLAYRD